MDTYSSLCSYIAQTYSWGQLLITEELFRKLMTALKVHPDFLNVLHMFGEKITAVEEGFTTLLTRLDSKPLGQLVDTYSMLYLLL
ncbi:hypothetical protein BU24DRAFT_416831, partial [Aaosphaeria arxii CBS 175.79]